MLFQQGLSFFPHAIDSIEWPNDYAPIVKGDIKLALRNITSYRYIACWYDDADGYGLYAILGSRLPDPRSMLSFLVVFQASVPI